MGKFCADISLLFRWIRLNMNGVAVLLFILRELLQDADKSPWNEVKQFVWMIKAWKQLGRLPRKCNISRENKK